MLERQTQYLSLCFYGVYMYAVGFWKLLQAWYNGGTFTFYAGVKLSLVMQITIKSTEERNVGFGDGYLINSEKPDYLVGRVLTLIEALGLPDKQEKSIKDVLRSEIYGVLEPSCFVPHQLHTIVKELREKYEDECQKESEGCSSGIPNNPTFMSGEYTLTYKE